jgi:hypothetical protein
MHVVLNTKVYSETTKIKLKVDQHEPPNKNGADIRCSGRVSSSSYSLCKPGDGISYQLRDINLLCRCCQNVATYKWKVHNEADLDISVISFISNSMETTF